MRCRTSSGREPAEPESGVRRSRRQNHGGRHSTFEPHNSEGERSQMQTAITRANQRSEGVVYAKYDPSLRGPRLHRRCIVASSPIFERIRRHMSPISMFPPKTPPSAAEHAATTARAVAEGAPAPAPAPAPAAAATPSPTPAACRRYPAGAENPADVYDVRQPAFFRLYRRARLSLMFIR